MEAWRPAHDASGTALGAAGSAGGGRAGGAACSQGHALYRARGPALGLCAEGPAAAAEGHVPPRGAKTAATNRGPGGRAAASSPLTSSLVILAGCGHPEATHGRDIIVHNLNLCCPPFYPIPSPFLLIPSLLCFPPFPAKSGLRADSAAHRRVKKEHSCSVLLLSPFHSFCLSLQPCRTGVGIFYERRVKADRTTRDIRMNTSAPRPWRWRIQPPRHRGPLDESGREEEAA